MAETQLLTRHQQREAAIQMLREGFTAPIVATVTGLDRGEVLDLNREIHNRSSPPGMLPETRRLCRTGLMGLEVSLLIDVYRAKMRLKGRTERDKPGAYDLVWALRRYHEVRRECQLRQNANPLTPAQTYVVLRDWSSGQIWTHTCRSCDFVSYYHQSMDPYCYPCMSEGMGRAR